MDKLDKYIQGLKDNSSRSKQFSAYKLGIIADEQALTHLLEAMDDPKPSVRSNVAEALGNIRKTEALEYLYKYIDDKNFSVKYSVIVAIGDIAKQNPDDKDLYKDIIPKIIATLGDEKYMIRHCSCETLANIGGEDVENRVRETLINGNEVEKEFAIWTIGKMKNTNYVEQLMDIFEETENDNIKRALINVFTELEINVKSLLEERGLDLEKIREELFVDDIFNDKLYYKL